MFLKYFINTGVPLLKDTPVFLLLVDDSSVCGYL